jgi:hypothetical protein
MYSLLVARYEAMRADVAPSDELPKIVGSETMVTIETVLRAIWDDELMGSARPPDYHPPLRAGDQTVTIGKVSLDTVIRERDNAVARAERAELAQRMTTGNQARDHSVLLDMIEVQREKHEALKQDYDALLKVLQWRHSDNPAAYTLISTADYERLTALEEYARKAIGELVELVSEPGFTEIDNYS